MREPATPVKVKKVYTAAQLLGKTDLDYRKALNIAERFTESEIDRILRKVAERKHVKNRLTLVR